MGTSTTTATNLLKIIFQAVNWANICDNAASSPNTSLFLALHTADPGAGGSQNTSEIAYTSYARVAVARTSGGWTVTSNAVTPVAAITFPAGTGGSGTATFFSIGMLTSGAGIILFSGPISPTIVCGSGVTPSLSTASSVTQT